jgi:hypothetical protein
MIGNSAFCCENILCRASRSSAFRRKDAFRHERPRSAVERFRERRVRSILALSCACALWADETKVAWCRSEHYIDDHERKRDADQRKNKAVVRTPAIGCLVPVRIETGLLE